MNERTREKISNFRTGSIAPVYLMILVAALVKVTLNLVALSNSGFMGDEFLHIDAGNHLSTGYMDFPPMIGFFAWMQNLFHSDSIFVHHLISNLAAVVTLVFTALTTKKLGGGLTAIGVTLICIIFSPGFAAAQILFVPVGFELMFWIISIYFLASWCQEQGDRNIYYMAIFAALGFLTKYSIGFLFGGLFFSLLLFKRGLLKRRALWIGVLLFLVLISPNLWWQIDHQFPVVRHMSELYDTQLNKVSILDELKLLAIFMNPVGMAIWVPALLVFPFLKNFRDFRLLTFTLLFSFILLFLARGKFYYYMPIVLGLIPLGSVFLEHWLRKLRVALYAYMVVLCMVGVLLLPHGMPLLKLENYISWYKLEKNQDQKVILRFDNYYSWKFWDPVLESVKKTYENLEPGEQSNCLIWGRHYAHAGAINLLGRRHKLPWAFSFHSSYFEWVPEFPNGISVIAIADPGWTRESYLRYFKEVEEIAHIKNPYGTYANWDHFTIFLCSTSKYNSTQFKEHFKDEIY